MAIGSLVGSLQRFARRAGAAFVPKNSGDLPGVDGVYRAIGVLAAVAEATARFHRRSGAGQVLMAFPASPPWPWRRVTGPGTSRAQLAFEAPLQAAPNVSKDASAQPS